MQYDGCLVGFVDSAAFLIPCLKIALVNPSIGTVLDTLENLLSLMVAAGVLGVWTVVVDTGPQHGSSSFRSDR